MKLQRVDLGGHSYSIDKPCPYHVKIENHVIDGDVPFATLTACRGNLSPAENNARTVELARRLRSLNLSFKKVDGSYIENTGTKVSEKSFFVIGDKNLSIEDFSSIIENLGSYYQQDSVLIGVPGGQTKLVSTTDNDFIGPVGSEKLLGKFSPTRIGDYSIQRDVFEAKTRREMGYLSGGGLAIDINRKKAIKGKFID